MTQQESEYLTELSRIAGEARAVLHRANARKEATVEALADAKLQFEGSLAHANARIADADLQIEIDRIIERHRSLAAAR